MLMAHLAVLLQEPELIGGGSIAGRMGVVLVLVLINGFFVAAEFSLVAVRRTRIDELAEAGDKRARTVQGALQDLDRYIAGTQLGITIASLGLGWVGEPAVAGILDRILEAFGMSPPPAGVHTAASFTVGFLILTFLHIVLGELAPKSVALVRPESVSRVVSTPLIFFSRIMSPLIWLCNGAANALLKLFNVSRVTEIQGHSPDELRLLVMQSRAHGRLDESDTAMLAGVLDFNYKKARDVMRPRTEVVSIETTATE